MEFHIYLDVITAVIIGFISAFLLLGFWVILQGVCEIIRRKKSGPTRAPIEQEENRGEASGKSKKLVSQWNRKAAYGIIIVDRLKLVEDHDISWISHLSKN